MDKGRKLASFAISEPARVSDHQHADPEFPDLAKMAVPELEA